MDDTAWLRQARSKGENPAAACKGYLLKRYAVSDCGFVPRYFPVTLQELVDVGGKGRSAVLLPHAFDVYELLAQRLIEWNKGGDVRWRVDTLFAEIARAAATASRRKSDRTFTPHLARLLSRHLRLRQVALPSSAAVDDVFFTQRFYDAATPADAHAACTSPAGLAAAFEHLVSGDLGAIDVPHQRVVQHMFVVLTYIVHSYVWGETAAAKGDAAAWEYAVLPWYLAVPYLALAKAAGVRRPVLNHAACDLWNWSVDAGVLASWERVRRMRRGRRTRMGGTAPTPSTTGPSDRARAAALQTLVGGSRTPSAAHPVTLVHPHRAAIAAYNKVRLQTRFTDLPDEAWFHTIVLRASVVLGAAVPKAWGLVRALKWIMGGNGNDDATLAHAAACCELAAGGPGRVSRGWAGVLAGCERYVRRRRKTAVDGGDADAGADADADALRYFHQQCVVPWCAEVAAGLRDTTRLTRRMRERNRPDVFYGTYRHYLHGWGNKERLPQGLAFEMRPAAGDGPASPQLTAMEDALATWFAPEPAPRDGDASFVEKTPEGEVRLRFTDVSGGSAAQNTVFQVLDAMVGVQHTSGFLKEQRMYMPSQHVAFLEAIEAAGREGGGLREYFAVVEGLEGAIPQPQPQRGLPSCIRRREHRAPAGSSPSKCVRFRIADRERAPLFNAVVTGLTHFRTAHFAVTKSHVIDQIEKPAGRAGARGTGGTQLREFLNTVIEETQKGELRGKL